MSCLYHTPSAIFEYFVRILNRTFCQLSALYIMASLFLFLMGGSDGGSRSDVAVDIVVIVVVVIWLPSTYMEIYRTHCAVPK